MSYTPTTWATGDTVTAEKLNNMESGISAAAILPSVGASDKNKFLHTNSSTGALEWSGVSGGAEDFIITCTPTSADMSGTTDKTAQEALAAYQAGKNIKVRVYDGDDGSYNEVTPYGMLVGYNHGEPSFLTLSASVVDRSAGLLMIFNTSSIDTIYTIDIYTLTPYSP